MHAFFDSPMHAVHLLQCRLVHVFFAWADVHVVQISVCVHGPMIVYGAHWHFVCGVL